ncbi:TetR/AcrR family transcriptional regulator [Rhodococcus sp. NPDC003318]|uniref:TetR/AcrR family transcriptional regulator n=1 Tax=Rhodococcus sp. NPDC003318 TaxID=3364503 RepID=UPI0036C407EA
MRSGKGSPDGTGRQAVLDAAVENMTERGYHGTSIRDVARTAGLTVASIYHHFASKQEILQVLMAQALDDAYRMTGDAAQHAGPDPRDQLAAVVRAWVLFHTTRQRDAVVGATEIRSLDEAGLRATVDRRDRQEGLFREIVDRGVESGVFATDKGRDATRAIINMGQAICTWFNPAGPLTPTELADRYSELALVMVEADRRPGS